MLNKYDMHGNTHTLLYHGFALKCFMLGYVIVGVFFWSSSYIMSFVAYMCGCGSLCLYFARMESCGTFFEMVLLSKESL